MLLQWTSLNYSNPQAQWGKKANKYLYTALSNVTTYTQSEMCGPPASESGWADPGMLHQALLTNLEPSTRYHYRVGDPVSNSRHSRACSQAVVDTSMRLSPCPPSNGLL